MPTKLDSRKIPTTPDPLSPSRNHFSAVDDTTVSPPAEKMSPELALAEPGVGGVSRKSSRTNFRRNFANFFGAIGYFSCSLLWLWTIMLYSSLIEAFTLFISSNSSNHVVKPPVVSPDSGVLPIIIVVAITIIIGLFTLYILIKMPSVIVKTGKKVVHETAENATPIILRIQRRKDTKKRHRKLALSLILVIKIMLIIIPVGLSFASQFIDKQMIDFFIAMYVNLWLACFSVIFFVFQYFVATALSVKKSDLW